MSSTNVVTVGKLIRYLDLPRCLCFVIADEYLQKYNPDLQRRALENREDKLREANEFVAKLKEYSKDSRPIWTVQKEDELRQKILKRRADAAKKDEKKAIADEIRRQRLQGNEESEG